MGAPKLVAGHFYHYQPVMRVIAQDGEYTCGVCRSSYDSFAKAQSCLNRCFYEWIEHAELKKFPTKSGVILQCSLCGRATMRLAQAMSCLADCKKGYRQRFRLESSLIEFNEPLPPPPERTCTAHLPPPEDEPKAEAPETDDLDDAEESLSFGDDLAIEGMDD